MKTRRKYSREFKIEAVRMANEPGITLKQIGAELGVNPHLLGKWRKQMQEDGELPLKLELFRLVKCPLLVRPDVQHSSMSVTAPKLPLLEFGIECRLMNP